MAFEINDFTPVRWSDGTDAGVCTLAAFFAENSDGVEADEQADIRAALVKGEVYQGGGGAAVAWTLERVG